MVLIFVAQCPPPQKKSKKSETKVDSTDCAAEFVDHLQNQGRTKVTTARATAGKTNCDKQVKPTERKIELEE